MPSSNNQPASWLKKVSHWFSATQKKFNHIRVKQKISELEEARNKEKKVLAQQRRFYERLFSRSKAVDAPRVSPAFTTKESPAKPLPVPPPPVTPIASSQVVAAPIEYSSVSKFIPRATPPPTPAHPQASSPTPILTPTKTPILTPSPVHSLQTPETLTPPPPPLPTTEVAQPSFFSRLQLPHFLNFLRPHSHHRTDVSTQERESIEKRSWEPYDAIKPNLIKNQEVLFFNWHEHLLVLALSLVMCCLAISLVYVGLLIWQKERLDANRVTLLNAQAIDDQIVKTEKEVREIKNFNIKLLTVGTLLDNHIYWTNYFAFLENATLKDVYYQSFKGDLSGEYTIPAIARNLEAVSLQLEVMKGYENVKSITPETGTPNELDRTIPFNLGMSIDPLLFIK